MNIYVCWQYTVNFLWINFSFFVCFFGGAGAGAGGGGGACQRSLLRLDTVNLKQGTNAVKEFEYF